MSAATKTAPAKASRSKAKAAQPVSEQPEESTSESTNGAEPTTNGSEVSEHVVDESKKVDPMRVLYPLDAELFAFTAPSTGETFYLPVDFEKMDMVQAWEVYDKPMNIQTWELMKHARVPRLIQRKAVELLRDNVSEYMDMFNGWMQAAGGVNLGNS